MGGTAGAHTGGCLCGRLRYETTGPITSPHLCSCEHCQRWAGGPAVAWADVPVSSFTWTGSGEPAWYNTYPDSKRGFCATCGSSVCVVDEGADLMGLTLMSLDDPSGVDPVSLSYSETAPKWFRAVWPEQ